MRRFAYCNSVSPLTLRVRGKSAQILVSSPDTRNSDTTGYTETPPPFAPSTTAASRVSAASSHKDDGTNRAAKPRLRAHFAASRASLASVGVICSAANLVRDAGSVTAPVFGAGFGTATFVKLRSTSPSSDDREEPPNVP